MKVSCALKSAAGLRWRGPLAVLLLLAASAAQAGLFDDEEARKAILDLRARIQAGDDAGRARVGELEKANNQVFEQLRRSLLDLNAQLEAQRADNAKLRGTQEQIARDLAELQRTVKEAAKSLDDRLRQLEPQKVSLDGKDFIADPDERRAHDQAMAALRSGDFDKAAAVRKTHRALPQHFGRRSRDHLEEPRSS